MLFTALAAGQVPEQFEVASIKPQAAGDDTVDVHPSPGGFAANGVPLKLMIQIAYGLKEFQVSGGPGWIMTDRYNVLAKAGGGETPSQEQTRHMLQALLSDRFKLRTHREIRDLAAFSLVVNKGGPRLTPSADIAATPDAKPMISVGRGVLIGKRISMTGLADALGMQSDRTVLDRTGIQGTFDLTLKWSPDVADTEGLSLVSAIREQLGLRLESTKAAVEVLVIDSAEKASEN